MESDPAKESRPIQQDLFDDLPLDASPSAALGVVARQAAPAGEKLSSLQRKFNNLVRRIEALRASIAEETALGDEILAYWAKEFAPVLPEIANTQIQLAFAIDEQAGGFKLGVRQKEAVGEAIVGLLGEAFNTVEAQEDSQALFSRWSETSFDEELEAQEQEAVDGLREAFREGFGIEIDEETLAKGPEAISEALLEQAEKMGGEFFGFSKPRKKTAKQIAKEEREKQAEEQAKKGLRSLYLSLVKVLHPDIEPDPALREIKERNMKDLTRAYEAGDIHTILRLEMEWIASESAAGKPLPEEKLKAYIATLSSQLRDLEEELEAIGYLPRFMPVQEFVGDDLDLAMLQIDIRASTAKSRLSFLRELVGEYSEKMEKQVFIVGIKKMVE